MRRSFSIALGLALACSVALAGDGPLKDKPLPELKLSHTLQGAPWSQEDLKGSIVVLEIFQLG